MGVLLPVLQSSRAKARQATCLSNLRQISQAIQLYTQDHDERLPRPAAWGRQWIVCYRPLPGYESVFPLYRPERFLPELINPYLKSKLRTGVWWCPQVSTNTPFPRSSCKMQDNEISYFWNHATPPGKPVILVSGLPLSAIRNGAEAALSCDMPLWGRNDPKSEGLVPPHFDRVNVAYADGHVKLVNFDQSTDFWRSSGTRGFIE